MKERPRKDDQSMQPVWQNFRRCFTGDGLEHEARDFMAKGKGKSYDGRDRFGNGKGRPSWNDGKGFGKGFGKGKKGKPWGKGF